MSSYQDEKTGKLYPSGHALGSNKDGSNKVVGRKFGNGKGHEGYFGKSKHVLDLRKKVANKMKAKKSLGSSGKNEGETMMGNNKTERNRS